MRFLSLLLLPLLGPRFGLVLRRRGLRRRLFLIPFILAGLGALLACDRSSGADGEGERSQK